MPPWINRCTSGVQTNVVQIMRTRLPLMAANVLA